MSFLATWGRVVGTAAARRALPVWTAVAVLAVVVFGGTGMQPEALTAPARLSWRFGAVLAAGWVVLVVPAGRAMLAPRATAYLRALPVARWQRALVTGAIAVAVQAPWTLLWALGAGPLAAVLATAAATAAMLGIAAAADRVTWRYRRPRWRGRITALLGAHLRLLVRGRGAALVRAAGIATLGGASAGLVARANQLDGEEAVWWALAEAALALPMAIGALAHPVVDGDRRLDWLLRASGCSWPTRVLAAGGMLALLGAALGALAGAACALVGETSLATAIALVAWLALLGAGVGGLALRVGAWASAIGDGGRVVVGMALVAMLAFVAIGALGLVGVVVVAAGGFSAAVALAAPRAGEAGA